MTKGDLVSFELLERVDRGLEKRGGTVRLCRPAYEQFAAELGITVDELVSCLVVLADCGVVRVENLQ